MTAHLAVSMIMKYKLCMIEMGRQEGEKGLKYVWNMMMTWKEESEMCFQHWQVWSNKCTCTEGAYFEGN